MHLILFLCVFTVLVTVQVLHADDSTSGNGVVAKRPEPLRAKQAGEDLCSKFGFRKLPVTDPGDAPVGAVIVYGGRLGPRRNAH